MITQAIILAGGLGTRLRSVVPDQPKCLAVINGKPFLYFIIQYLKSNGITKFIFSLGYRSEDVKAFLEINLLGNEYSLAIENEPLGTGGAIQLALKISEDTNTIIVNGDTYFNVDLKGLSSFHFETKAECSVSLKPTINFSRYGVVEIDSDKTITSFKEKQFVESGLINGGVYALDKEKFIAHNFPDKFSFEKDYLEAFVSSKKITGFIQDKYFIDIGIPEDYAKAQTELITHI